MSRTSPKGILFDKDGTLFDFSATWDSWAAALLRDLSKGDPAVLSALAEAVHFDLALDQFKPSSPVIAGTNREAAERMVPVLPGWSVEDLQLHLSRTAATAPLAPVVPLAPLLDGLARMGLTLGVMTNDSELGAREHLGASGVLDRFDFVAGADSGFGAKPEPEPLLAFADTVGLDPADVAMVGDSTHDLMAGRAAGMQTVGVLTGPATAEALAPWADVVLPDISHLPGWVRADLVPAS